MSLQVCQVWYGCLVYEVHPLQPSLCFLYKHISLFSTFPQKARFSFLQMFWLGKPLLCWAVH